MPSDMRSLVVLIVLGAVAILGCGDDDPAGPGKTVIPDSISIKSVTPDSRLVDGVETGFAVAVEYYLASVDSGEIGIGFNNVQMDKFHMITSAEVLIAKSSGEHLFNVTVATKDWGGAGDFQVFVILSEHPHESSWKPLDGDTRVLTFE